MTTNLLIRFIPSSHQLMAPPSKTKNDYPDAGAISVIETNPTRRVPQFGPAGGSHSGIGQFCGE